MRTLLLSKSDEQYLQKCAMEHKFAYGIIIAHNAEPDKCIAVHLARNSEEDGEFEDLAEAALATNTANSHSVANQWISATKMCAGSFDVMGIFVASIDGHVLHERSDDMKNAKKLFTEVHSLINRNNSLLGSSTTLEHKEAEYIYLAYSAKERNIQCLNFVTSNGGKFSPMDHRIVEKPFEWVPFECNYELDEIYPTEHQADDKIDIEQQFRNIVDNVREDLKNCELVLTSDPLGPTDDTQQLMRCMKKKENGISHKVTILLPIKQQQSGDAVELAQIREFERATRLSGVISSRIFCNPRNTVADAKRFVREDILRSLAARTQIYCDGLTDTYAHKESVYISEPPQRVYFSLPASSLVKSTSPIQFSEYLFRGEASTVAVAQAKQVLDIAIDASTIVMDAESQADEHNNTDTLDGSSKLGHDDSLSFSKLISLEISRPVYWLGIALLIVLVALLVQYLFF